MALTEQSFATLVSNQVAAIQASSSQFLDFDQGSIMLSVVESNAGAVGLWLQAIMLQLLSTTRAATSIGPDLDSWMADYNFPRLQAVAASGNVTFSRQVNTVQALIPVGATVQSADGTQTYSVIADTTNVNYSSALNAYIIPASTSSTLALVQDTIAGSAGNASIGVINTLTTAIPYVDSVTNASAFTNGADAETDSAYRTRFVNYISSLSRATKSAIGFAVQSVQQGVTYTLTENLNYNGSPNQGYFYVVADDGSHNPPSSFLTAVGNAVEAYRGFTITYGIFAPVTTTANVSMTITTIASYSHATAVAQVTAALQAYINGLVLGQNLPYTRLEQVAYDAVPASIINVTSVLLNSGTSDLTADNQHVIVLGTVTVT